MSTTTGARLINTRITLFAWLSIWLAFAVTLGATKLVTADQPVSNGQAEAVGDGALVGAGISVSGHPVRMTAAETVVQIRVDGRDDLGNRLADAGPVMLVDAAGGRHFIQRSYLEGRSLTFTFAGSASVAPGLATLELARVALTNDPIDVAPGQERVTHLRSSPLSIEISSTGGPVRHTELATSAKRTKLSSSAVNSLNQGATVTSIVQDDQVIVVNGNLDGFSAEEIQSLNLGATRLILADGSELPMSGGSNGNEPDLRGFTFWFELPSGSSSVAGLQLSIEVSVPEPVRQSAPDEARARLEALEAAGKDQLLISFGQ